MNGKDDIADVACALQKRTMRPSVWGEKLKEAERKTRASFVSVFGGSSQDAQKPTSTASAQNADDGAGQAAKEPQGANQKANGKHGKKGGRK